jgi:RecA-family ATPase
MENLLEEKQNQTSEVETTTENNLTITELKEKILDKLPLGLKENKLVDLLSKYTISLKADDSVKDDLYNFVINEYEDLHYRSMAELFFDYGFMAVEIEPIQTLKENILSFPTHIWKMKDFDFNVKTLQKYIGGKIKEKEYEGESYKLSEIKNFNPSEDDVIIKNLLYKKQYLMMTGQPKIANKTRTACYMIMCISKGLAFLGMETKKQRVLCMLLEDTPQSAGKRFHNFGGVGDNVEIYTTTPTGIIKLRMLLQKAIEEENPYGLVIIDTYLIFTGVKQINDYGENVVAGNGIKKIATDFNVGVLVIHHDNKNKDAENGNQILGSNAITGSNDGYISLKNLNNNKDIWKEKEDPKLSMDMTLRHFESPESIIFTMTNDGATLIGTKKYNDKKYIFEEIKEFIKEKYSKKEDGKEIYFSNNDLMNEYNNYLEKHNRTDDFLTINSTRTIITKLKEDDFLKVVNGKGATLL